MFADVPHPQQRGQESDTVSPSVRRRRGDATRPQPADKAAQSLYVQHTCTPPAGEAGLATSPSLLHLSDVHLDGSSLLFDDVFKLVSFYCVSRCVQKHSYES